MSGYITGHAHELPGQVTRPAVRNCVPETRSGILQDINTKYRHLYRVIRGREHPTVPARLSGHSVAGMGHRVAAHKVFLQDGARTIRLYLLLISLLGALAAEWYQGA